MGAIGFGVVAAAALVSALFVVWSKNLVHAVMWLAVTLLSTAALYAMLGASVLAGVQALVYVGGVITLLIFGVMVTRRHEGIVAPAESSGRLRGGLVAGALFGVVAAAIRGTPGLDGALASAPPPTTSADLGRALLDAHVLAFEVVSLLLLAAIIGALVIARRKDPVLGARAPAAAPRPAPEATHP